MTQIRVLAKASLVLVLVAAMMFGGVGTSVAQAPMDTAVLLHRRSKIPEKKITPSVVTKGP